MTRILIAAFATALLSACSPSQLTKDYSLFTGCPKEKVEVSSKGQSNTGSIRYRVSGCGNGADYICREDESECASPMITVARRHAKQFGCDAQSVTVEYLDGGSWRASGCNHELTYHCFETREILNRCIAETDDRPARRKDASEQ
jgi:hypothetical protein